jgi:hypothetical protein
MALSTGTLTQKLANQVRFVVEHIKAVLSMSKYEFSEPEEEPSELDEELDADELAEVDLEEALGVHVITLTYWDNEPFPRLNLGGTSPLAAKALLQEAIAALDMVIPPVSVEYNNEMILQPCIVNDEDED